MSAPFALRIIQRLSLLSAVPLCSKLSAFGLNLAPVATVAAKHKLFCILVNRGLVVTTPDASGACNGKGERSLLFFFMHSGYVLTWLQAQEC